MESGLPRGNMRHSEDPCLDWPAFPDTVDNLQYLV